MDFNSGAYFNRGALFNRQSAGGAEYALSGTAAMVFTPAAVGFHSARAYGAGSLGMVYGSAADKLAATYPLGLADAGIVFANAASGFSALVNLGSADAGMVYTALATAIRVNNDAALVLSGLAFRPGDTIIIDTDTLDVFINGQPDVSAWVTGSQFFQLSRGSNSITIYDDASSRSLGVTVVWADRWL